eukprot:PITA_10992
MKDLYQNRSDHRKLALEDKLRKIRCERDETISMYLTKLITCKDELASVGVMTSDEDMVILALLGLPKSWHNYQDSVNGREKLQDWEQLWKSKKGSGEGSEGEALASQSELDFTLFACMVSSMVGSGWFLDSGASFHMIDNKSLFNTLEEKDLQILIVMGNDEKYSVSGVGTIIFHREHGSRLTLTDVKYVPGMKRNLVSIAMLEDRGYDVVFSKGKVFLRHIITR